MKKELGEEKLLERKETRGNLWSVKDWDPSFLSMWKGNHRYPLFTESRDSHWSHSSLGQKIAQRREATSQPLSRI